MGIKLEEFRKKKVAVIGDLMLDKYIFGNVERISPEAPVPIVHVQREKFVPGGAANAAANVATLGGNAYLFGVVGNDAAKEILIEVSKERLINTDGLVIYPQKPTIQKIRVLGQSQQLLRIDYENQGYIDGHADKRIFENVKKVKVDCIVISDYAKGSITEKVVADVKKHAKTAKIPLIVDPKPKHKSWYHGVSLITPNKAEAEEMSGIKFESLATIEKGGMKLQKELDCNVLITLGEKGMSLFEKGRKPLHIPTVAKEVYDVSGAGDTVIATLSLAMAAKAPLKEAAQLANIAAGIKVGKIGTAPVTLAELKAAL